MSSSQTNDKGGKGLHKKLVTLFSRRRSVRRLPVPEVPDTNPGIEVGLPQSDLSHNEAATHAAIEHHEHVSQDPAPERSGDPEANPAIGKDSGESNSRAEEVNDKPQEFRSPDTLRSLERYNNAMKLLKEATKVHGDDWGSFEFPELDQVGEYEDITILQTEINRVLDSRDDSLKNTAAWPKLKEIVRKGMLALTGPFVQRALSIATTMANVIRYCGF